MNIAIFSDTFLPQINGIVSSTINLSKGLADRGHKIHLIVPKYSKNPTFKHKNITIIRIPSFKAFFYEGFRFTILSTPYIFSYLRKNDIQIVHFETPMNLGVEAIVNAKLRKIPVVGTFHTFIADKDYLKHVKMDNMAFERFAWGYINFFNNRCDLVTSPSESTARELKKRGCRRRIEVISNGIDMSMFDDHDEDLYREKFSLQGKTFLYAGRIAYEKNIDVLVEAFQKVVSKEPQARLLLIGAGPQLEMIRDRVKRLELDRKVFMPGAIEHSKLVKSGIFHASDIFVTASVTENQPMNILEAMANGLACIGPASKGIPDLIEDRVTGRLVKPKDPDDLAEKMLALVGDKDEVRRMSRNTIKKIKKHDMRNVLDTWEDVYSGLIRTKEKIVDVHRTRLDL